MSGGNLLVLYALLQAQVRANLPDQMRHARYARLENRALPMFLGTVPDAVGEKALLPETCALSTVFSTSLLHTNRAG